MKKVLFRTVQCALAVMLFVGQIAIGQQTLYKIPETISARSLIRNLDDSIDIIYNTYESPSFLYVNRSSNQVVEAALQSQLSVMDMEIVGKEVYFCGSYFGKPAIGRFDIISFFFAGGYAEIDTIEYYPTQAGVTGHTVLTKLEVQYIEPYNIHVYAIGRVTFGDGEKVTIPDGTALFDCLYNGTYWHIEEIHTPGWVYMMYDLTVTQQYLYIVGEKQGTHGDYSNWMTLPGIVPSHILPSFNMLTVSSGIYCPISESLTETFYGDAFVTVCHGMVDNDTGIVITQYSVPWNIIVRYLIKNETMSTKFVDLKYNSNDNKLYLMPDKDSSILPHTMYVFDLTMGSAKLYRSNMPESCSADRRASTAGAVVSGITADSEIGLWVAGSVNNSCTSSMELSPNRYPHETDGWDVDVLVSYPHEGILTLYPDIISQRLMKTCL